MNSANETSLIDYYDLLEPVLSAIPNANFAVFGEDFRIKLVCGQVFDNLRRDPENYLGKTLEEISPDHEEKWGIHLRSAWEGNNFEADFTQEEETYEIKITKVKIPQLSIHVLLFFSSNITRFRKLALKLYDLLEKQGKVIEYEENLHREVVQIFNWRQEIEGKGNHRKWMEQALPNLNTSLMQGSGLGALVTAVGAMLRKAKKEGEVSTIPTGHLELVEENFKSTKKLVKTLAEAQIVFEEANRSAETISLQRVMNILEEEEKYLADMLSIKSQTVMISKIKNGAQSFIRVHPKSLQVSFREILINAMKYSPENSSIIVLLIRSGDKFSIKVLNPPIDPNIKQFDFKKSEEIVLFQPFYRVSKFVDERYPKEEFGLGLGLSVVKKLMEDMEAKIYMNVIHSNLYANESMEVSVSLEFSLVNP
ncbi:ATP-binding protein [Leptospira idonii]|uniref:ATP-binding protein n=1 Tax=Leptospira idonii TaxID=1193500 RepID=A0A4R9M3X8_9LEPT|nr:ATP-binding protein [Leptospira idonii]TGN19979.1 ATP-binding protein [Leptospira idonii]